MLRGKLYTITNENTSDASKIKFGDFKQSTRTNPTLADIVVVDALDDPETGSGRMHISAWQNHVQPTVPNVTIDHTGNVGIGVESPQSKLHVAGDLLVDDVSAKDVTVDTLTFSDGTGISSGQNMRTCKQTITRVVNINASWKQVAALAVREQDSAILGVVVETSGGGAANYQIRAVRVSDNATIGQATYTQFGLQTVLPVSLAVVLGSTALYDVSIQLRHLNGVRFRAGLKALLYV